MNTQPHRLPGAVNEPRRSPPRAHARDERRFQTISRGRFPLVHRRYPSLSDDGQTPFFSVRLLAALAIIAIILGLLLHA